MQTITGTLLDTAGQPVHARVTVESLSTPLFAASGVVTGNTTLSLLTDPDDGTFEFQLKPGIYQVTYATTPKQTSFRIEVTNDSGTASIDDLVEIIPTEIPQGATAVVLYDAGLGRNVTVSLQNGEWRIV